jgi:hypothetical protein
MCDNEKVCAVREPGVGDTERLKVNNLASYLESCAAKGVLHNRPDGAEDNGKRDREPGDEGSVNTKRSKTEMIEEYLKCLEKMPDESELDDRSERGRGGVTTGTDIDDPVERRPTRNIFWRDGEKVITDDAEDGFSSDFLVRLVYLSVKKTLDLFTSSADVSMNIESRRTIKDLLRSFNYANGQSVKPAAAARAGLLMSNLRNFALAMDTSKGARHLIVNQMDPQTCHVSVDYLQKLCRFCGFGDYNEKYGTLSCRFYLPIKLLFLGNLKIKHYDQDGRNEEEENKFYNIDLSNHFGQYLQFFIERLYDVCFEMLQHEHRQHKGKRQPGGGTSSSLAALSSHHCNAYTNQLDGFDTLTRRDSAKILGTSGKLQYIRYEKSTNMIVGDEPVEEADAVFVSSYIGLRINRNGEVCMNIYTRHAMLLEIEEF